MSVTVGVLALQGGTAEHLRALGALGVTAIPVRRATEVATLDGLVIPGGESTTIGKLLHLFGLADPIRSRIAGGMPVFGSCAGMILLADRLVGGADGQRTLGGLDVTVRRNAFGRQVDSFEEDLAVPVLGEGAASLRAVFIRAPWVEEVGDGVEVLARTASRETGKAGPIVAVQEGNVLATSFHPEVGGDLRLHEYFVTLVRSAVASPVTM